VNNVTISSDRIKEITEKFKKARIMVVGDIMIDEYMWGEVNRISPEAPVPVVEVEEVTYRLGGAANVVQNLCKIGIEPVLVSVIGNDQNGEKLCSMLTDINCSKEHLYKSKDRPTTIKTRIMAKHQQVVRADHESCINLSEGEMKSLLEIFETAVSEVQGVIVSDYGKGVICPEFLKDIITLCNDKSLYIAIDPKERHFNLYNNVTVITPNLREAHTALGLPYSGRTSDAEVKELGWKLLDTFKLSYLLLTLSERGMALFEKKGKHFTHLPTVAKKVYDVTGAGDTVISLFSAAIACGATPVEAAFIANHGAGLTVAELGTSSVDTQMLLKACTDTI
jgi:D-beta-D-heptose 7-phosphate kinase/D-beta-D-heptose 1-phosphate adenosyltransferase